jgi:hypothetical protein
MTTDRLADFAEARLNEDLERHAADAAFKQTIIDVSRQFNLAADANPQSTELRAQADAIGALVEAMAQLWSEHADYTAATASQ